MIQLQCLNYILRNKDIHFITDNNLSAEFFSDYPKEYSYIVDHIHSYETLPDFESFITAFPDFDVIKVDEPSSYLLTELYKDKNKRNIANTFNNIRELLVQDKIDEAMTLYNNSLSNINTNNTIKAIDILHDNSRYSNYIERSKDYTKHYIKTGFPELDELIGGWDRQEDLVTIVARNGVGKSQVALKSAVEAAKQGFKVGLYSGEMSANMVGYRADTFISHLSNIKMIRGNLDIQNEYKKYLETIPKTIAGNLFVFTPDMIDSPIGINALQNFIDKYDLDILYVDQHSLLEDDRKARNSVDKASNISRDLKHLQSIKHIPIIAVSQQNRSSTENGFNTALIAQSDRIGQDSTIVIFLDQKDGVLTLHLIKSRFSASDKKLQYAFDFDKGIFTYIPSEDTSDTIVKPIEDYESISSDDVDGENVF